MLSALNILFFLGASFLGGALSFLILRAPKINEKDLGRKMNQIVEQGKEKAKILLEEIKAKSEQYKKQAEEESKRLEETLAQLNRLLSIKDNSLNKRYLRNQELKKAIEAEEESIKNYKQNITGLDQDFLDKLIKITGISKEESKQFLIQQMEHNLTEEKELKLQKMIESLKEGAHHTAVNILTESIHKFTAPTSVERKISSVIVPRDAVKGLIVGKNAENILYFENKMDVDVVFNDLPKTITIFGHDLIKRHIATQAIDKMAKLRAINHKIIDEKIKEAEKETEAMIYAIGKKAALQVLGPKYTDPKFLKIIGRLKFRTSYGQNILEHSMEVSAFSAMLAGEISADIEVCRIAGFLHDIGKAIDHEVEGSHDALSKEILTEYKFSEDIIHAVYAHHEAEPCRTPEAMIVKAADALSAGRPGARQESLDKYLERLHELENTACSFQGVQKTFAISAGREIRVMVNSETVNDEGTAILAKDIAAEIERKLNYPGKIRVNVIRKTHTVDYAK